MENKKSLSPVKIGLIGAGVFGGYHAWKVHDHPNASLALVFDEDYPRAEALAAKIASRSVSTLNDCLRAVDAVIITTPAPSHAAIALKAFEAGCHVFVEKPIALIVDEADKMIRSAESSGLVLQIGHQERYVAEALGLMTLPEMPREIECRRCMPQTGRGEDVSVVMDLMIHDLDLALQFIGADKQPTLVVDRGKDPAHQITAILNSRDDAIMVTLKASRRSIARERSIMLQFDQGEIHLDFLKRSIHNTAPFDLLQGFGEDDETDQQPLAIRDPLAFGLDQFIDAITANKSSGVTGKDGRRALDLAVQIETAAGLR